jgi:hypothetical protein
MFEFYDPIFEEVFDPSNPLSDVANQTEEIHQKLSHLVEVERAILAPLYRGRKRHWQGNQLGLPLKSVFYRVRDSKKIAWPWFGCSPGWEIETAVKVCGKLNGTTMQDQDLLKGAVDLWSKTTFLRDEIIEIGSPTFAGTIFEITCRFNNVCGDACLALYTVFAAQHKDKSVAAAGFFGLDKMPVDYLEIGGSGQAR